MSQTLYDNKMLRRYLLGTANADEAARLDELSLTDDDCALALTAVENDLLDSYASASLNTTERAQFELHYLATPFRREKAHFAVELQRFAQPVAASRTASQTAESPMSARFAWFNLPPLWQTGLATAAALLLIACGWLWVENRRWREQANTERAVLAQRELELTASQKAAISKQDELNRLSEQLAQLEARVSAVPLAVSAAPLLRFTLAAPLRGATALENVAIPPTAAAVAVRLELETNNYPHYRVGLRDPLTNRVVWQSGKLAAQGKVVTMRLPSKVFAVQRYAFELSGVTANGAEEQLSSYPFSVVRP